MYTLIIYVQSLSVIIRTAVLLNYFNVVEPLIFSTVANRVGDDVLMHLLKHTSILLFVTEPAVYLQITGAYVQFIFVSCTVFVYSPVTLVICAV